MSASTHDSSHTPHGSRTPLASDPRVALGLAALVVVATTALIIGLMARRSSEGGRSADPSASASMPSPSPVAQVKAMADPEQPTPAAVPPDVPKPLRPDETATPGLLRHRLSFAATLERRYRDQSKAVQITVGGDQQDRLILQYTREVDREHLAQLQQARPLFRELRDLGFHRLEIRDTNGKDLLFAQDL